MPPPLLRFAPEKVVETVKLTDAYPLGGQEDGTWSGYASLVRRRNVQEDNAIGDDAEHFVEVGGTYRYFNENRRLWHKTTALARLREHGGETLGVEERIVHRPVTVPVTLRLDADAYLQNLEGRSLISGDRTDLAFSLRGTISQPRRLNPKTHHLPELFLFVRYLTRNHSPDDFDDQERLDQDVFSPYKSEHQYGLGFGDTLVRRPWLDTLWYSGFSLTSNEDLNLLRPDHLRYRLGWKQLLGPFDFELGFLGQHYFDDGDRNDDVAREQVFVELGWDLWVLRQHRTELRLRVTRDLDRNETLGMLSFFWHGGNGRGYRDFWPGEVDFLDLRERRASVAKNNGIDDGNAD